MGSKPLTHYQRVNVKHTFNRSVILNTSLNKMGGNLFRLGRIPREEYLVIEQEIRAYLDQKWTGFYRIPRYYTEKPDFGDLDIIFSQKAIVKNWVDTRQEIMDDLGVTQFKSGGSVFSTVYKNFQVDYFLVQPQYLESTYNFLSFNDLGNLLGKICRKFSLKYGEKGLVYVFRRKDGHYKKDLKVSTDFQKICSFLELDYQRWVNGFSTLEEMFEWVIASKYFSIKPYQKQNNSDKISKRAKNRPTVERFLRFIQEKNIQKTFEYLPDKEDYTPFIDKVFPEAGLLTLIKLEQEAENKAIEINQKFNGKIIMNLKPELEGKALGDFIVAFKKSFSDFEAYILNASRDEIREKIINFKLL